MQLLSVKYVPDIQRISVYLLRAWSTRGADIKTIRTDIIKVPKQLTLIKREIILGRPALISWKPFQRELSSCLS